jgi:Zn-dependent protease with chaperone function
VGNSIGRLPSTARWSIGSRRSRARRAPATIAAGRAFGASLVLGTLGMVSASLVIARLFESWRLSPRHVSHAISLLGQRLTYPTANAGAIVVTALAVVGLAMATAAASRAIHELLASRSLMRALASRPRRRFDEAWLIEDTRPQAFCAGLLRPRVYVSSGALEVLDSLALCAVLAHEHQHARRRDPLRLAAARVLTAGLFFVPGLRRLIQRQRALAELGADEAAVLSAGGDRSALAEAMLSFAAVDGGKSAGFEPERIDHLLGERVQWALPVGVCLLAVAAVSTLAGLAVLAGRTAAGSATLAPPLLSGEPCIAVLAMIPAAAALIGAAYLRRRSAPRAD